MKKLISKTLITLLLLALLSACAVNTTEPVVTTDPQVAQPVDSQAGFQANAIFTGDPTLTFKANEAFDANGVKAFSQALEAGKQQFSTNGFSYQYEPLGPNSFRIYRLIPVAESLLGRVELVDGVVLSNETIAAMETAVAEGAQTFEHQGSTFVLSEDRKAIQISVVTEAAIANQYYLEAYEPANNEIIHAYNFVLNFELALQKQERSFFHEGDKYSILAVPGGYTISDSQSNLFAELSNIYVIPRSSSMDIPLGFKNLVRDAIENDEASFYYTDSTGIQREYQVEKLENSWSVNPAK